MAEFKLTHYRFMTDQLKLWWLSDVKPVDEKMIDAIATLGTDDCRIYGFEQGGMPWGTKFGLNLQEGKIGRFLANRGLAPDFKNFKKIVDYAHSKGFKFITGTVDDPRWIRTLVDQGVDGIVPNNPVDFQNAGIVRPHETADFALNGQVRSTYEKKLELARDEHGKRYVPPSMQTRIENYRRGNTELRVSQARKELESLAS